MPNLLIVSQQAMLAHVGIDITRVLPGHQSRDPHQWHIAVPTTQKDSPIENIRFFKSVAQEVDDEEKKANFSLMVNSAFHAADNDNFVEAMSGTIVEAKQAQKFSFQSKTRQLFELKRGKKDRIYYFPFHLKKDLKFIVFLLAHHKNTNTTPQDVKVYAESQMKSYLKIGAEINFFRNKVK